MAYFLTIDIGNTTAKAALWHGDELAAEPIWGKLTAADIRALCAGRRVSVAAICSVANDDGSLGRQAEQLADRAFVLSADIPVPVSLDAYGTRATLGTDRIAALCGARALIGARDALVVDCGTAITYDRLSADARFLGGNIAPGIGMRLRALHAFTSRLPLVESVQESPIWGRSTAQAMQSGALYGAVAEIEFYLRQCPPESSLVLTGGRCHHLAPMITCSNPIITDKNLVLRGLKYIIDYNENI